MKILYARYSRERHPHFQMKTVIYEENGIKKVMKQAINASGSKHIQRILKNYNDLKSHYKADVLLEPFFTGDSIWFEFINHSSLDQLLLEASLNKQKETFFKYIELYKRFINEVAMDNYSDFINTEEFVTFFKKEYPLEGLKAFNRPNVDLNFDNIFLIHNNRLKVLDYEWVLDFPVPLEFVIFRAVNTFYYANHSILINFVGIDEIFDSFGMDSERIDYYIDMSICFADFVGTNQALLSQNKYLKKTVPFEFKEPETISAQLFYSGVQGEGFSEENSMKLEVDSNTSELRFIGDLDNNPFRLDPADKKCVVLLDNIIVYNDEKNSYIVNSIDSNAAFTINSTYYFMTDDPQLYFSIEPGFIVSEIVVSLKYIHFTEEDFFLELSQSYEKVMNHNSTLLNSFQNLQNVLDVNEGLLKESNEVRDNLKSEIAELLSSIESLQRDKSESEQRNDLLQNELNQRDQFIEEIKGTYWWRVTSKIKRFFKKNRV